MVNSLVFTVSQLLEVRLPKQNVPDKQSKFHAVRPDRQKPWTEDRKKGTSWIKLYACHISSSSSGRRVTEPLPSFSTNFRTSFIVESK
jgi:hypothetical protein